MKFANRQRGLGVGGWLILILLFGGAMTIGMKLVPLYMDHNTMSGVLDGLAAEQGLAAQRPSKIQETIVNRFRLNNIRDFDWKNKMTVKREKDGVRITLEYDEKIPLAGNVQLLASFHKEVIIK